MMMWETSTSLEASTMSLDDGHEEARVGYHSRQRETERAKEWVRVLKQGRRAHTVKWDYTQGQAPQLRKHNPSCPDAQGANTEGNKQGNKSQSRHGNKHTTTRTRLTHRLTRTRGKQHITTEGDKNDTNTSFGELSRTLKTSTNNKSQRPRHTAIAQMTVSAGGS